MEVTGIMTIIDITEHMQLNEEDFEETSYLRGVKKGIDEILMKDTPDEERASEVKKYIRNEIMRVESELAFSEEVPLTKKIRYLFSAKEPSSAVPVDLIYTSNVLAELERFVD